MAITLKYIQYVCGGKASSTTLLHYSVIIKYLSILYTLTNLPFLSFIIYCIVANKNVIWHQITNVNIRSTPQIFLLNVLVCVCVCVFFFVMLMMFISIIIVVVAVIVALFFR